MGFEGVGVFSNYSGFDPPLFPMFNGGITTAGVDFGLLDDPADGGRGIAILPELFGVSLDCFEFETFLLLLDYLLFELELLLELLDEGALNSSFPLLLPVLTDDIFD
jgi:hypothetical protein